MVKISSLIITLSIVSLMVVVFSVSMVNTASKYGNSFDSSTVGNMSKIDRLSSLSTSLQTNVSKIQNNNNIFNQVDAFFGAGFSALKLTLVSSDIAYEVSSNAGDKIETGDNSGAIKSIFLAVIAIIITTLVIFAIISAIVGREE